MTDPEGDAECPDAPDLGETREAPPAAEEVWYTGRERARSVGEPTFTPVDPEQVMRAIEQGLAGHRGMLSPLEQQCVALREFYLALRKAGFTQDEAFDYLHRQQQ